MFNRNNAKQVGTTAASIATNSSTGVLNLFVFPAAGEVIGGHVIASASQPSATTTASGLSVNLYKNASNSASIVGSFNSSGTGIAANAAAALTLGTATLKKFAANDVLLCEVIGGAAMGSTIGLKVQAEYIYGYED